MDRGRRARLTVAAAIALVVFVMSWAVLLGVGSGQCGNEDTVECTPLGWVLLYGWMALGVFAAALMLLVVALWAAEAGRNRRRRAR